MNIEKGKKNKFEETKQKLCEKGTYEKIEMYIKICQGSKKGNQSRFPFFEPF